MSEAITARTRPMTCGSWRDDSRTEVKPSGTAAVSIELFMQQDDSTRRKRLTLGAAEAVSQNLTGKPHKSANCSMTAELAANKCDTGTLNFRTLSVELSLYLCLSGHCPS